MKQSIDKRQSINSVDRNKDLQVPKNEAFSKPIETTGSQNTNVIS